MKYRDNLGKVHDKRVAAAFTSAKNKVSGKVPKEKKKKRKSSLFPDRSEYEYGDVQTYDKVDNLKTVVIDYETQSVLLKNDDGDVVISSKIDDVIMQTLNSNSEVFESRIGYVDIVPLAHLVESLEKREAELIDICMDECKDDVKKLINASVNPASDNYEFNNRLIECQSKILSTAMKKDNLTFQEGGEKFINTILDRIFREMFVDIGKMKEDDGGD